MVSPDSWIGLPIQSSPLFACPAKSSVSCPAKTGVSSVLSLSISILFITGSCNSSNPSPRSASKKLASTLRSLSFKRREELKDGELLQQPQDDPYHDLETAYVAQICLTWEALHCQYTQLSQKISSQPENSTCYIHAAQRFQQFQVLLQRFIENEPFEQGHRVEIYARSRCSLPMLLQVPSIQGKYYEAA